ncbi:MAG: hypothetical protein M0T78_00340 [Actinomycetota bacterium]|nr:hypothetical protein [Actinomycetota bacterium]
MSWVGLGGARLRGEGSDPQYFHEPANLLAVDLESPAREHLSDLSGSKGRMGQLDLVHLGHHFQVVARLLVVGLVVMARAGNRQDSATG